MPRLLPLPAPALLAVMTLLSTHFFPEMESPVETRFAGTNQDLAKDGRIVLSIYCSSCHNQGRAKIDLNDSTDFTRVGDRQTWENMVKILREEKMPPLGGRWPVPSPEERQTLITWIEQQFLTENPESARLARWRSRRLLRHEYVNAIRDLFGSPFQPAPDFPEDSPSWKQSRDFPTLAGGHLEKYQEAAEQILQDALMLKAPIQFSAPGDDDNDEETSEEPSSTLSSKEEEARDCIAHFAMRAFRRPLARGELKNLVDIYQQAEKAGREYEECLKAAFKAVLTSPHFLFRIESVAGDSPSSPSRERPFQLASRLAFMLWSSIPDDELLVLADRGLLEGNLEVQARRMLEDPRAQALSKGFAHFWLELGKLPAQENDFLRAARQETEQFVAHIIEGDRNVLEFLDADYTFLNELLAKHYGIAEIKGGHMRRVSLKDKQRGGLVTQASILTLFSHWEETSPVQRGKWILENLLGSAPLAPPSGLLQAINETRKKFEPGTARQLMEQHRANPSCASCHAKMDALGIALENFGGTGAWRTKANGRPVDATATLPSGETFTGPVQLKAYLLKNQDLFLRGLAGKLLSYALGRKLENADVSALDGIPQRVACNQHRFSSLLVEVIRSERFLNMNND